MRIVIFLMAGAVCFAQERTTLTLKRAVEIALAPDGAARARLAEEILRQAEARSAQARSALLPNVEGSASEVNQTRNLRAFGIDFPSVPGIEFPALVGPFDVVDFRASVTQSVFDFSAIRRWQASKTSIEAARAERGAVRSETAAQVSRAYLSALRAGSVLETARANVTLAEALVKLAQSQKDAGTGTGIEVTRAQVQLANDRQNAIVAENELRREQLRLMRAMGLEMNVELELAGKLEFQPVELAELEKALGTARSGRAELKAAEKREEAARQTYSAAGWERAPTIGAFADYGTIGNGSDMMLPTRAVGVSVKVPIFDGGRRGARRAEAFSQLRQEEIRRRDIAQQVEFEVRVALNALRSAEAQVTAAKEGLELAQNELAQAQRRYQAGVANSLEVTDAQTRLQRARGNQIAALYSYNVAAVDVAAATGTIEEFIAK